MPEPVSTCHQRRNIGGDAEIGGVPKRSDPAKPDQQIEAECKIAAIRIWLAIFIKSLQKRQKKQVMRQLGCGIHFMR